MGLIKSLEAVFEAGAERAFSARITTSSVDREGEVLLPQGLNAADYEKNPVVFWNHDYDVPLGRCTGLSREAESWHASAVMAARPAGHQGEWFPDTVHALMQQGVIRGVSVGFLPVESRAPTAKDRAMFGPDVRRVHSKWKLLEFSVTPLPANQEALVLAVSKGLLSEAAGARLFGADAVRAAEDADRDAAPARRRVVVLMPGLAACEGLDDAVARAIARAQGRLTL